MKVKDTKHLIPKKLYKYLISQTEPFFDTLDVAIEKLEKVLSESKRNKTAILVLEELKKIEKSQKKS